MKYAGEMGSVAMIYIPSFVQTSSCIQKLIRVDSQTHRQHGHRMGLRCFQNTESRLQTDNEGRCEQCLPET
jgi:hypothetical protein